MNQNDRITFSNYIVNADAQITGLNTAKTQMAALITKTQANDDANNNLFIPVNDLINSYYLELSKLDGITRSTIIEQNIKDSAHKILGNYFYPNDTTNPPPSLSGTHGIWTKLKPFSRTLCVGKNNLEVYGSMSGVKEPDKINAILSLISSASTYTDMQNTTGQIAEHTGTCSLPSYTTQSTCMSNGGIWMPGPDTIVTYPDVQTLKTNMVVAVNDLISFLNSELSVIVTDKDAVNQALNQAAKDNINNVILPALNAWLANVDFNTSHGQTSVAGFNGYDSNLLAPTKLHSTQLTTLTNALNTRTSFIATRIAQFDNTILGPLNQDLSTGVVTGNGLYLKRYNFLVLRLDALNGSLNQLVGLQTSASAQDSIIANIVNNKAIYMSLVPTSLFKAPASGGPNVHLLDVSFLHVGDQVFVVADNQTELIRSIKAISGNLVTLNDTIPAKFDPASGARLYKDLN